MFPLSELDRMLPLSDTALHTAAGSKRGRRSSRPSVSSRGTRTILKEPETRRLKNRGHLARNRKFESISLLPRLSCEPHFLGSDFRKGQVAIARLIPWPPPTSRSRLTGALPRTGIRHSAPTTGRVNPHGPPLSIRGFVESGFCAIPCSCT